VSALLGELAEAPEASLGGAWDGWLRPGAAIGELELVREIGRGGFGVVWEARDRPSGRAVAFKAVRAGGRAGQREDRLLREAEVAARLAHPNVVALEAVGRCEHGPYLVLELLRGEPLHDRLERRPLASAEALRIGVDVARALAHAHAQGVVHRDLKPANVFLCEGGSAKVLDFGLAHAFGHRRAAGGTPSYMAPEQWRGAPEDERTDVFALGVLLHRMLAGELPFPDDGGRSVQGPQPAPGLDVPGLPALGGLVAAMLEKDPVLRPRDASAVLPGLEAALRDAERLPAALAVSPARRHGALPSDPRAWDLCERGRRYLAQTRKTSLGFAAETFQRAIELDPRYAPAHAGLAEAAALLQMFYRPDDAQRAVAERESRIAMELDPNIPEARTARGLTHFAQGRHEEAERELQRALAMDPRRFEAWYYYARVCFQQGRLEEALRLFRRATEVREDYQAAFFAAQTVEALGRAAEARTAYANALEVVERHLDLNPDDARAATMRAVSLCRLGRREEGLRWAEQALSLDALDAGVRYNVACLYALEGATERALSALEESARAGYAHPDWIARDPDLASLRREPRFQALLRQA
jgi:tetratricopeptide (TPR) repeat protein